MESLGKLGIDLGSLLLYAVNFGIVVLIAWRYITRPLLKMLDERRHKIQTNITEAEALKKEMTERLERVEEEKRAVESKLHEELSAFRRDLERKQKEAEAHMDTQRAKMFEEAQKTIDDAKARLFSEVKSEMLTKVKAMVLSIVSNRVPHDVVEQSVQEAWNKYA